jgi:hypothetical protein
MNNSKLDVGGTLSEVFSIYRDNAGVLLPVAFWLFLVVAIVNGIAGSSLILLLLAAAVGIAAGTLYQGMVVNLVGDVQDGRRDFSAGELLSQATPFIVPLIGAGILAGIGITIGLFLLVVPGLILLTIWAVIAPVIVVEKSGVFAAFSRSRELVRGNGWRVFSFMALLSLSGIITGGAIMFYFFQWNGGLKDMTEEYAATVKKIAGSIALISSIMFPLMLIFTYIYLPSEAVTPTVFYYFIMVLVIPSLKKRFY